MSLASWLRCHTRLEGAQLLTGCDGGDAAFFCGTSLLNARMDCCASRASVGRPARGGKKGLRITSPQQQPATESRAERSLDKKLLAAHVVERRSTSRVSPRAMARPRRKDMASLGVPLPPSVRRSAGPARATVSCAVCCTACSGPAPHPHPQPVL